LAAHPGRARADLDLVAGVQHHDVVAELTFQRLAVRSTDSKIAS
jgi:hypothetical protein